MNKNFELILWLLVSLCRCVCYGSRVGLVGGAIGATGWLAIATAQDPQPTAKPSFAEALESIRTEHGLPGLIAGCFSLDGDPELVAVGRRKASLPDPLQSEDPMHLGSCTKSMTATLIGMLVDEGKLAWDTRLVDVFADDPLVVNSPWGEATIDQLLRHTSGAPANPPWSLFSSPTNDIVNRRAEVMHWLTKRSRKPKAIGEFLYSNLGYAVLGHVIEKLRGCSWEDEIRTRLFEPLEMSSAGFGPPTHAHPGAAPWGHINAFGMTIADEIDNPPVLGPAGTVHASMGDWIKYLRVHLMTDPAGAGVLPIRAETLAYLHRAHEGESYVGGWVCDEKPWAGGPILMHNGSNRHWYCVVFLALEQKRGILAACNMGGDAVEPCDQALQLVLQKFPFEQPSN